MKKHLFSIFTVLAFCLISCSNGSNPVEPPHEHTFSETWNFDDTYHWHDSTCGHDAVSGKGMHNFGDWIIEEDATEYKEGSKYKLCSVCSYRKYEKIDILEHTHKPGEPVEENKVDATCTKDGSYDLVIRCKECHEIISSEHMIIKALDHDYQLTHTEPATYEHDGELTYTCSRCGNSYTTKGDDKLVHHYSSEWSIDYQKGTHYHACTDRGYENERSDEAPHEFFDAVTSPTHLEGGYTTHTCKVCGYSYTDTITDRVPYVVTFNLNGGTSTKLVARQEVFNFKQIYFVFDCKKDEYSFRGWSYKDEQVFDETGKQLKTIEMEDNMVFTAIFRQTAYVKITTNMSQAGEIKGAGEYPYNSYVDLSVTPYQGYVFAGWYYQGTLLSNYLSYRYLMWDTDVTLEARFALDSYKLNIHTNNEEYGLVLLKYSYTYTTTTVDYGNGTSVSVTTTTTTVENKENKPVYETNYDFGSSVQIAAYSKTDVRFLGWYDEDNNLVSNKAVYSFSMPSHDYTLEAKWNHFKINYNLNGGTNSDSNPAFYTIDETVSLARPYRDGYNFIGWKYHDEYITTIDSLWLSDVTIDAIWEATTYQITYHLNGGTNNVDNPLTYTIETPTITLLSPERTGYTFDGWYSDAEFLTSVTSIKKGSIGDINLYAKWNVIFYSITYELNGGVNDSSNPSQYTIEDDFPLLSPTYKYRSFDGWYSGETKITGITKGTTGDLYLNAKWNQSEEQYEEMSQDLGAKPVVDLQKKTVSYGLYPQTNVNDTYLLNELNKISSPESNGWYLYNSEYYAKITAYPYDSIYTFDNGEAIVSEQVYWFKCEPIVWNILKNDNGEMFLLSSVLLDTHNFYSWSAYGSHQGYNNNYEYSDLRKWLNSDFYNLAFSLNKEYIQTTLVHNDASTTESTPNVFACNDTNDKVFLLSYQEYCSAQYGFTNDKEPTETRYCKTTDYARARGAKCSTEYEYLYNGYYWTRSPYVNNSYYDPPNDAHGGKYQVKTVQYDGLVCTNSELNMGMTVYGTHPYTNVELRYFCARPAITIKVS